MPVPVADSLRQSALVVLECLEDMGARHSNAVLEILPAEGGVIEQHKYPPDGMSIASDTWRVYYHSHEYPDRDSKEHGHFHIFRRIADSDHGMQDWTHVAGLAMDREGQPLYWFAVNRWVTNGAWLAIEQLEEIVSTIMPVEHPPVARWLLAMLKLYRNELALLFRERDKVLLPHNSDGCAALQEDRSVYGLARRKINLVLHLESVLTDSATLESGGRHEGRC